MTYIQQVEKYLHYVKKQNKILHAYYLLNTNIYICTSICIYMDNKQYKRNIPFMKNVLKKGK